MKFAFAICFFLLNFSAVSFAEHITQHPSGITHAGPQVRGRVLDASPSNREVPFVKPGPYHFGQNQYDGSPSLIHRNRLLIRQSNGPLININVNSSQNSTDNSNSNGWPKFQWHVFNNSYRRMVIQSGGGGEVDNNVIRPIRPNQSLDTLIAPASHRTKVKHPDPIPDVPPKIIRHRLPLSEDPTPNITPPILELRLLSGRSPRTENDSGDHFQAEPQKAIRHRAESKGVTGAMLEAVPEVFRENFLAALKEVAHHLNLEIDDIVFSQPKESHRGFFVSGHFSKEGKLCRFDSELDLDSPELSWVGSEDCDHT
jgi:hypothetical protein